MSLRCGLCQRETEFLLTVHSDICREAVCEGCKSKVENSPAVVGQPGKIVYAEGDIRNV